VSADGTESQPISEALLRSELDAQREEFHRELMRKELRIAELELGPEGAEWHKVAAKVVAEYESTLSWRVTKPLRAAKRPLARIRRRLRRQ
jgi:hypothetical protein